MTCGAVLLLVDDDALFLESMHRRLEKHNLAVVVALNAEEGLAKLSENKAIDVVIMDVSFPGMDGITALSKIKEQYPSVEVIMLSGHGVVESALRGIQYGAFDYLMKPCDMKQLIAKVEQARTKRAKQGLSIRS